MRHTSGEEPDIATAYIVDEVLALLIDSCQANAALEHETPFIGRMPGRVSICPPLTQNCGKNLTSATPDKH